MLTRNLMKRLSVKRQAVFAMAILSLMATSSYGETTVQFEAILSSDAVIAGGTSGSTSESGGTATIELNYDPSDSSTATLSYDIRLTNADLDGNQTENLLDDVTAIHIHDVTTCVSPACVEGDTAGTLHVLNIFGMPRQDDVNLQVMPNESRLTGLWDASDANSLTPAPSFAPSDYLDELFSGEIYLMLHSREFAGGAFGGQLVTVPEPSSISMLLLGALALVRRRR